MLVLALLLVGIGTTAGRTSRGGAVAGAGGLGVVRGWLVVSATAASVVLGSGTGGLVADLAVLDDVLHGAGGGELAVVVVLGLFFVLFGLEESAAAAHFDGGWFL